MAFPLMEDFLMRWIPVIALLVFLFCRGFMAATARSLSARPESPVIRAEPVREEDRNRVSEVTAFEELSCPPDGQGFQYFEITLDGGDGSARRVVVRVKPSLIEDWATKIIKSRLPW